MSDVQSITINGRSGTVVYIDSTWKPVEPARATLARVLFDDGSTAFYTLTSTKMLGSQRIRTETLVHKAADAYLAKMTGAFEYGFAQGRAAVNKRALQAALIAPDPHVQVLTVMASAPTAVAKALDEVIEPLILKVMAAGGDAGLTILSKQLKTASEFRTAKPPKQLPRKTFKMRFDAHNPAAVKWARKHTAELIDGISKRSEQAIIDAVEQVLEEGDLREAYDEILYAVGDPVRAQLIARTETMMAATHGQREGWAQAVEEGLLTGDERREWIATVGACDECQALDGKTAPLDGSYPDPGGEGPILHPNCRCTEGIIYV